MGLLLPVLRKASTLGALREIPVRLLAGRRTRAQTFGLLMRHPTTLKAAILGSGVASIVGGAGLFASGYKQAMHANKALASARSPRALRAAARQYRIGSTKQGIGAGLFAAGPPGGVAAGLVGYVAGRFETRSRALAGHGAGSKVISRPLTGDYLAQHGLKHGSAGKFARR